MNVLVIAVLSISILCIVFSSKLGKRMAMIFHDTGLFAKINNLFLRDEDKNYFERVESIEKTEAQDLKQEAEAILQKHGKKYASPDLRKHDVTLFALPASLSAFFSAYDYLAFETEEGAARLLEVNAIARQEIGDTPYFIVGCDREEDTCFLVKDKAMNDAEIYGASSRFCGKSDEQMRETDVELVFQSIEHFVVYYAHECRVS